MMKPLLPLAGALLLALPAQAEERLRGKTVCFPADKVIKIVDELAEVEADRRDVVDVGLQPRFLRKDGGAWPTRFYLQQDDTPILDIAVEKPSGATPSFLTDIRANQDADICIDDPTRADRPEFDEGLYFEMGLSPIFHNREGLHTLAEMEEGAKDGKKFYKKMIPGAFRPFMPDTDYMAVKYVDTTTPPALLIRTPDRDIPIMPEAHKDIWVVGLDEIEAVGGVALVVRGGAYDLRPVPSVKTMRKFGWGQETETGGSE
jgi:hypothetical protein